MSDPRDASSDRPPGGEPSATDDGDEGELLRGMFLEEALVHLGEIAEAQQALARAGEGGARVEAVDALLRHLHSLKGAAGSVGFDSIGRAAHDIEELCAEIRVGSLAPTPGILDRIDESIGGLRALLDGARAAPDRSRGPLLPLLPPEDSPSRIDRRRLPDRRRGIERRSGGERTLRVESARLDALSDGVGDLIILRTRVERRLRELEGVHRDLETTRRALRGALAEAGALPMAAGDAPQAPQTMARLLAPLLDRLAESELELGGVAGHLDRATRALAGEAGTLGRTATELDEELRGARLIPLDWAFGRLPHALRELERTTGRAADLVTGGGDVEVDKGLVEPMADALLHLLRNAVAHGLEAAEERAAAGKPARGRLEVRARQEGELVVIDFADDGRGIDREEVRRGLARRGRPLPPGAEDTVLLAAIFEPGFSIRESADGLAGRGMGLDIVKRAVVRLGGEVDVESTPGAGTRFRLAVPLHAAITEAVLFKVGGQVYALPAVHVVKALASPPAPDAPGPAPAARLPVLRLQSLLGVEMPPGHRAAALQVRYDIRSGDRSFIVTCDKIVGPRTIVVKPLGPVLGVLPLFAGATVSGAGKAQLVFDVGALAEAAYAPARAPAPAARRAPARVLVADDSRLTREGTARVLVASGLQALTAEDGWEAWEMLGERRFDALITDLEMPRLDGFELIERVRHEATLKELPIVVMSSRTARASRAKALAAGANAVLPKTPHKKLLVDTITALLARARDRGPGGEAA
jgi:chemotaxis protein histidine kinase CheA/ActR/RegA family two-component response regulator